MDDQRVDETFAANVSESSVNRVAEIEQWWQRDKPLVLDVLRANLDRGCAGPTRQVVSHLLRLPGKMARPRLTMTMLYRTAADPVALDRAVRGAASVEMLHTGTLYHDDVIDHSPERRGVATANALFGNAAAVLGGDILLAKSSQVAASLGRAEYLIMAETLEALCQGQLEESATVGDLDRTEASYMIAIEGKTAWLIRSAVVMGALQADVDDGDIERLGVAGMQLGLAFQMLDDVLDLIGRPEVIAKRAGQDLREGVITLPVILAMAHDPTLRPAVEAARSDPEAVARCIRRCIETGAITDTIDRAMGLAESARATLAEYFGDGATADHVVRRVLQIEQVEQELVQMGALDAAR